MYYEVVIRNNWPWHRSLPNAKFRKMTATEAVHYYRSELEHMTKTVAELGGEIRAIRIAVMEAAI